MQEYQEIPIEETETQTHRRTSLGRDRLLVLALVLSVGGFLAAFWLSGVLLSTPDNLVPTSFLQLVATHRPLVLLAPAICLGICFGMLRSLTGEIMGVPERFLDERQQMLRDQAHRSAFKIIKLACVLIPLGFLVPRLPWFNATPTPSDMSFVVMRLDTMDRAGFIYPTNYASSWHIFTGSEPNQLLPSVPPSSGTEIILACGLLLLCAWLLLSALPMCVLAWQGKR